MSTGSDAGDKLPLSPPQSRYLLAVYRLSREKQPVPLTDAADALRVRKSSAYEMFDLLVSRGLVVRERGGKLALTENGSAAAERIEARLEALTVLLGSLRLGLTSAELAQAALALAAAMPERDLTPSAARQPATPPETEQTESDYSNPVKR
jgi:DtxR family Mn-dependent transcriptional regulator